MSVLSQASNLKEDQDSVGGANYNSLSPAERLQLLHLLCCDRLESKRTLVAAPVHVASSNATAAGTAVDDDVNPDLRTLKDDDMCESV
jgi:hypothetical protein